MSCGRVTKSRNFNFFCGGLKPSVLTFVLSPGMNLRDSESSSSSKDPSRFARDVVEVLDMFKDKIG
jgi:hypothetical protein